MPESGGEGVIVAGGGINGGWSLYVLDGKLTYHYSLADFEHNTVQTTNRLPSGRVVVELDYTSKGLKPGGTLNSGATVKLLVDGTVTGEGTVGSAMIRQGIEPFEIGRDSISAVSPDYRAKGSFPFNGTIETIRFDATPQRQ